MIVVAVILNWRQAALTIESADVARTQVHQVVVVDNGSGDEDRSMLRAYANKTGVVLVECAQNLGYSGGNNRGISAALELGADAVLLLNNDAFLRLHAVQRLIDHLSAHARTAIAMPAVVRRGTDRVLHTGCSISMRTAKARWEDHGCRVEHIGLLPRPTGYASGEAFLIRAAAVRSTGVFDETFFSYYEDAELSMRLRRDGWGIDVVPSAVVDHIVGASGSSVRGAFYRGRNGVLFLRRAGRSRVSAVICSAVPLFVGIGSHLRSGRVKVAFNGLLRGWFAGAIEAVRSS